MLRYPLKKDMDDHYINKFEEVMTSEWIRDQTRQMYYRNLFKEAGAFFDILHPIMQHYVDIWTSVRKAEALGESIVKMGSGNHELINLGRNLLELDGLYDLKLYRSRLQEKQLYNDACWELEVAQALKYNGFQVQFNDESKIRYDFTAECLGTTFAVECKNKQIQDKTFAANSAFAYLLGSRTIDKLTKHGYAVDLKVTVKETAVFEDYKRVMLAINNMLREGNSQTREGNQYTIEVIKDFRHLPTPKALDAIPNIHCCITGEERLKSELNKVYTERERGTSFQNRMFFSIPKERAEVKNLQDLIKKANRQVGENPGCLFLQVPYSDFSMCKEEISKFVYRNGYSNIHLVKIVALKSSNHGMGVKIDRLEDFVINSKARNPIPSILLERLTDHLFFSKFVNDIIWPT
ncbi:hypothetical protein BSK59_19820 [Paenibacillus odorifer]|nr:hypothetical protein BSK59_19820 [Paenibacillus odorifer]